MRVSFNLSFLGNSESLADTLASMIIRPQSDKCGCSTNLAYVSNPTLGEKSQNKANRSRLVGGLVGWLVGWWVGWWVGGWVGWWVGS